MDKQWHPLVELKSFHQKRNYFILPQACEMFCQAYTIDDEKKVLIFRSIAGGNIYTLLHSLLLPTKPQDKTFAELEAELKKHF